MQSTPSTVNSSDPCNRCQKQGQPDHFGSPVKCAFINGIFDSDNWQCATINVLRNLIHEDTQPLAKFYTREDMRQGSLGVISIPEYDTEGLQQGYLIMSWYKNRGRTGQAWVFWDDDIPEPLALSTAEFILSQKEL